MPTAANDLAMTSSKLKLAPHHPRKAATHASYDIHRYVGGAPASAEDVVAVEEPLEIRLLVEADKPRSVSITMRTPGDDIDLAAGFLFTEGILSSSRAIESITPEPDEANVVTVRLRASERVDLERLERHFYITSSCGVCGKSSLKHLRSRGLTGLAEDKMAVLPRVVHDLPETLRAAQTVFAQTGGLHGAGLFDAQGKLLSVHEDVGRHNAVDKVVGKALQNGWIPLRDRILMVSGRASFELLQKALVAQIPVLAAVGAPSSLAVDLAEEFQLTLIGFVRNDRFNVYAAPFRVKGLS